MIKIFVQSKPLYLIDHWNKEAENLQHQLTTIFADKLNAKNIGKVLQRMEGDSISAGIFQYQNQRDLLQAFKSHLTFVQAAGGFIFTPAKEILLILRRGKWDLPKGKLDEGESLEVCAMREVEEETGLRNIEIIKPLTVSYHTYHERGKHILKESQWYLMRCKSAQALKPQTEEDIEQCLWVAADRLPTYLPDMHTSLIDVVNDGLKEIAGTG